MTEAADLGLAPHAFDKQDASLDLGFYAVARLVTHIDDRALAALTAFYRSRLPADGCVLDLMSSWVSHLPEEVTYKVIGHGMNAEELAANPRFARWFVQDLNQSSGLPEEDAAFDAVLVCAGAQYLARPLAVFREVRRVLKPAGQVIVSYSNRCFPSKAVAIWQALDMDGQAVLIRRYLEGAGFDAAETHVLADGRTSDPLVAVTARI